MKTGMEITVKAGTPMREPRSGDTIALDHDIIAIVEAIGSAVTTVRYHARLQDAGQAYYISNDRLQ